MNARDIVNSNKMASQLYKYMPAILMLNDLALICLWSFSWAYFILRPSPIADSRVPESTSSTSLSRSVTSYRLRSENV